MERGIIPHNSSKCRKQTRYLQDRFQRAALIGIDESTFWHVPEGAAKVEYLQTTDPWAEDERGRSRDEMRRRGVERIHARSVSARGRSGSEASTDDGSGASEPSVGGALQNAGFGCSSDIESYPAKGETCCLGDVAQGSDCPILAGRKQRFKPCI